jgi:rSAM/selenodomain-associated transferase 1
MIKRDCAVLVFSKAPVPGAVKTRLQPMLNAAGAAELYRELLHRTLRTITSGPGWDTRLWCSPVIDHPCFQECRERYGVDLRLQSGRDVGARMYSAIADTLEHYRSVLLVGCDIPALQYADLEAGRRKLADDYDVVLGPAEDGGYYLIGMNTPRPELFTGMDWGSAAVLEATRKRLRDLRLKCHELPERWDLDTVADLERYRCGFGPGGRVAGMSAPGT